MSEIACNACTELREIAPEFVTNGVSESVCSSLAVDNGLNNNSSRTDAQDLHIANDCLIGRMGEEIESYDVCDWKDFMKKYISNDYEMNKGIICALGGLWNTLHTLIDALGGGNGSVPVMRRYRVTVPKSAFGTVWRVTSGVEASLYSSPEHVDDPVWHGVSAVNEWFAGSGNNVDVGEFWVKVPVSEMDDITGVWTQTWVVPGRNPYDGRGKGYIQTVNVQEWTRDGDYLNVNFDTYELCPPGGGDEEENGGPYPVTVDFLVVGTRKIL